MLLRRVSGTSMMPTLRPGTLVLAAKLRRQGKPGDVVIFRHDGLEKIKRVTDVRPGEVFLSGDNRDNSIDSRTFGWLHAQTITGRVIWPIQLRMKSNRNWHQK